MAITYCSTLGGKFRGKFLSQVARYVDHVRGLRIDAQSANVQESVGKMDLAIKTIAGNALSKTVHNFWLHRTIFGQFQIFTNDHRSMTKSSNSVKPKLSLYNTNVNFVTCTILEAHP